MNNNKRQFWAGCISGILVCVLAAGLVYFGNGLHNMLYGREFSTPDEGRLVSNDFQEKVDEINRMIDKHYVNYKEGDTGLTAEERTEGMFKGLVASLRDPYSEYYSAEEYKAMRESYNGYFEGVGALISQNKAGEFQIAGFPNHSPARDAGVEVGDIFYTVDGQSVEGLTLSGLVTLVRGDKGTVVELVMLRGPKREKVVILVERDAIESITVSSNMLDKEIGYLIISEFDTVTGGQFKTEIASLKKQGMKKLILDLRGNPGGSVEAVVEVADAIMPAGKIFFTKDSSGSEKDFNSSDDESLKLPIVVLVDGNSASAAEILAGALKDHGLATLIGTTTYGKGVVQNVYGLKDGSALKLTSARYYTPSGNNIQGTGIEPDIIVEFDSERYDLEDYDNQLEEAKKVIKGM